MRKVDGTQEKKRESNLSFTTHDQVWVAGCGNILNCILPFMNPITSHVYPAPQKLEPRTVHLPRDTVQVTRSRSISVKREPSSAMTSRAMHRPMTSDVSAAPRKVRIPKYYPYMTLKYPTIRYTVATVFL